MIFESFKVQSIWNVVFWNNSKNCKRFARKSISLFEAEEFCIRGSDEEDPNSNYNHESDSDCENANATIFGAPDDNLADTESDKLSSDNIISDTETEYDNPARKEIQFRRRRIMYAISSIETALDEKNYEPIKKIIEPIVSIENVAVLLEKTGKNITKSIIWATEKATQKCKTGVSNSSRANWNIGVHSLMII